MLTCGRAIDFGGEETTRRQDVTLHVSVITTIFDSLYHNFGAKTMAEECNRRASNFWLKGVWRKVERFSSA